MTAEQKARAQHLVKSMVKPGDIILTQTPSAVFGIFREMGSSHFDHMVAVIDEERCLHISYPYARLVPTILFMDKKKRPLILRSSSMSDAQRHAFIEQLKHRLVGKPYDYKRALHFLFWS